MYIHPEKQALAILALALLSAALLAAGVGQAPRPLAPIAAAPTLAATTLAATTHAPAADCSRGITPAQTEGPYYKPDTPARTSLLDPGMGGTPITLTGYVLSRNCTPIAGALLDFWQANDEGQYDNGGYTLRGHESTDASGRYTLQTIIPGLYPGRTRHIHVKVQAPNQPILTTQLYFPDEPQNSRDSIYDPRLLITWQARNQVAVFNFVLNVSQ